MSQSNEIQSDIHDSNREAIYDYYRMYVEPLRNKSIEYQKFAVEYAQIAVRSSYVINGGGLITIPAYANFLGNEADKSSIILAAVAFILSLIFIIICTISCHANFFNAIGSSDKTADKLSNQLYDRLHRNNVAWTQEQISQHIEEIDKLIKKHNSSITITFYIAWIFGVLSFASFILGCYLLALAASLV